MLESFIVMLGESLRHYMNEAISDKLPSSGNTEFHNGRLIALQRVFSLIEQAADICDVPLESISMSGIHDDDFLR